MDPIQLDNEIEEEVIPSLIADLGHENGLARQYKRLMLIHHSPESIPALVEALKSKNATVRWEAVRALSDIHDPQTASVLTDMLMDDDIGVRWSAMEGLIRMERACLRPVIECFLKDFDSPWIHEGVHHILHVLKDQRLLNASEINLFHKLDHPDFPGFDTGWDGEQVKAAEKALEMLNQEEK